MFTHLFWLIVIKLIILKNRLFFSNKIFLRQRDVTRTEYIRYRFGILQIHVA